MPDEPGLELLVNASVFAEWLIRQGHRVERTASSYWYDAAPRIFQSFPYHWVIDPSEDELQQLLRCHKALGLRYSAGAGSTFTGK